MEKIKKWFNNYWYYYKWYAVALAVLLCIVLVCVIQCSGQVDYDVFITYAGPDSIGFSLNDIRSAVKETLTGERVNTVKEISIRDILYVNEKLALKYQREDIYYSAVQNSENAKLLSTEAVAGDSYIYIIDAEQFEKLKQSGVFAPLSDIFGKQIPPCAYDDYGIVFNQTDLCADFKVFGSFGDEMILCLRRDTSDSAMNFLKGATKQREAYELHKAVFTDMVNYTSSGSDETQNNTGTVAP